jgi:release factor glutamine methyltransferase
MPYVRDSLEEGVRRLREAGSESARLDAELLLAHVAGVDRTAILAHPEAPLGDGQLATFRSLIDRRAGGEPVAYIRGLKEFYGLSFAVDRRALIPRPETEELVDIALARITGRLTARARPPGTPRLRVLDVGTGSGAVIISLALVLRRRRFGSEVRLSATDVSPDALALALENAVAHGVADAIDFYPGDLFDGLPLGYHAEVIVANLPYVPSTIVPELPRAASFEPRQALDGGADGLALIRRLLAGLPESLAKAGIALLEIGGDQSQAVVDATGDVLPGWSATIHPDLSGAPRVAELVPPPDDLVLPPAV